MPEKARLRQSTCMLVIRHVGKIERLARALLVYCTLAEEDAIRGVAGLPSAPVGVDWWARALRNPSCTLVLALTRWGHAVNSSSDRKITVTEHPPVPWLSIVLGYGPMVPFAAGAAAAWVTTGQIRLAVTAFTIIWAAAILAFLAGVRRGLSFRTEGGPTVAQIATMFSLFVLALCALAALQLGQLMFALAALLIGFAAILILDPIAAGRGEAPLFFARLRPPQIAIAVASLIALLLSVNHHG